MRCTYNTTRRGYGWLTAVLVFLMVISTAASPARAVDEEPRLSGWVPNGRVYSVVTHGDRVYIGGLFTRLTNPATGDRLPRAGLAALDATTGAPLDWSPSVASFDTSTTPVRPEVRALAVSPSGDTVYVGGDFDTVNGAPAARLAAIGSADGQLVPGWSASAGLTVRALVVRAGALYVGGHFGRVNGQPRDGLARLDAATGSLSDTWHADIDNGRVWTMTQSSTGDLLVGGTFTGIAGAPRAGLAAVRFDDGQVTGWSPPGLCDTCHVLDLASQDGSTYPARTGPGGALVAYSDASGAQRWTLRGDGDVQAVAVRNGVVYVGGHFGPAFGGQERHQLAAVTASDGRLTDFGPRLIPPNPEIDEYPGVWDLVADDGVLRVGGGFRGVGTGAQAAYAEFTIPRDGASPATLRLTASIQGAGSVESVEGGAYACQQPGNQDDRVTTGCAPATYEVPGEAQVWLKAVPAPNPAGHWRFVGWEGCDELRTTAANGVECGVHAAAPDTVERQPKAVFDDSVAPVVTGLRASQPASPERAFAFSFGADEAATFECRFGAESIYTACTSGITKTAAGEGDYPMSVRATDRSGNLGPAQEVSVTAVDTRITGAPSGLTNSSMATFAYGSLAGTGFECRLDGAAWQPCGDGPSATTTRTDLAQGDHLFEVRAVAGPWTDTAPAQHSWTVDTAGPALELAPTTNVASGVATFAFSADSATSCRLRGPSQSHPFRDCASPTVYSGLADGDYEFVVRARDAASNVSTASHSWSIDRTAPQTRVAGRHLDGRFLRRDSLRVGYTSDEAGSSFACRLDGVPHPCGASAVGLRGLASGPHRFTVAAIDGAGNRDRSPAVQTWTVPYDDTTLHHGTGWLERANVSYYQDSFSLARRQGAVLSTRITGARRLALLATRAPNNGVVDVYLGRQHLKRVRLGAGTVRGTRVIPVAVFDRGRSGRLRIVVASSGRAVRVDGLGVAP